MYYLEEDKVYRFGSGLSNYSAKEQNRIVLKFK